MHKLLFNTQKQYIYILTFVCNSLISVMLYKIHNELPGVGTVAKSLISVILYNVCNAEWWAPDGRKCAAVAILHA